MIWHALGGNAENHKVVSTTTRVGLQQKTRHLRCLYDFNIFNINKGWQNSQEVCC